MLSAGTIFLIGEITRIALDKLNQQGQLGTLTEEQAKVVVQKLADSLEVNLPSPEDLASGKAS